MPIYLSLQGFIIQARAAGSPLPVGEFQGSLPSNQTYMWCSGGEPQVHSNSKLHNDLLFSTTTRILQLVVFLGKLGLSILLFN